MSQNRDLQSEYLRHQGYVSRNGTRPDHEYAINGWMKYHLQKLSEYFADMLNEPKTTIFSLPTELRLNIYDWCSVFALLQLSHTCKLFYEEINAHPSIYKKAFGYWKELETDTEWKHWCKKHKYASLSFNGTDLRIGNYFVTNPNCKLNINLISRLDGDQEGRLFMREGYWNNKTTQFGEYKTRWGFCAVCWYITPTDVFGYTEFLFDTLEGLRQCAEMCEWCGENLTCDRGPSCPCKNNVVFWKRLIANRGDYEEHCDKHYEHPYADSDSDEDEDEYMEEPEE
ncbi:hypothetical protein BJ508DRAFT_346217 [Ascobolus immersus RN42]|uniref:F-box domain-containing protein n=1 Tax=Ascobolus immersus RN42 TaxID=1160509 RepID=A0A3N4IAJ2_ASCIM|nr:hypothetical protein BJ508DRAFT_346217 [Ascobolus immersus RN42]